MARRVILTAGAAGIGRAIVAAFAAEGDDVRTALTHFDVSISNFEVCFENIDHENPNRAVAVAIQSRRRLPLCSFPLTML